MKKSKMKQHVVPQSYLKRFARKNSYNGGYNIASKQIDGERVFISAIKDVAFLKNYYDVESRESKKHWEEYFATNIEPMYGNDLTNIIALITLCNNRKEVLPTYFKDMLSKMLGFQFVRVPGFLERRFRHGEEIFDFTIKETRKRFLHISSLYDTVISDLSKDKTDIVKDLTLDLISQERRLDMFSIILQNKTWIIYYNNSKLPFITSDSPIVMYNVVKETVNYEDNGLGRIDNIIYFPLTSKILLELSPQVMKPKCTDNSICVLDAKNVEFIEAVNHLQLMRANKQIFAHPNHQEYLLKFKKNPHTSDRISISPTLQGL